MLRTEIDGEVAEAIIFHANSTVTFGRALGSFSSMDFMSGPDHDRHQTKHPLVPSAGLGLRLFAALGRSRRTVVCAILRHVADLYGYFAVRLEHVPEC